MKGYFFNALKTSDLEHHPSGWDRAYDADDHAAFFAPFFSEAGVMAGTDPDACRVRVQSGNILAVHAGAVYIRGRMAVLDGTETITITQNCKVVVRLDKSMNVRDFQLLAVQEPERTEDIYDLELASAAIEAVTGGFQAVVTDKRTFLSYMGQPAYYPPDPDSLPYALWLYVLGLPMTEDQRAAVEGSPSLLAIYQNSLGASRAVTVSFAAADWQSGVLALSQARHGRGGGGFGYTLRHQVGEELRSRTWAVMETRVDYRAETGTITLTASAPYAGEITFFG